MAKENIKLVNLQEVLRKAERQWIEENRQILGEICQAEIDDFGRGMLLVNTKISSEGTGHPYWYLQQSIVEDISGDEVKEAVRKYDPANEFVLSLILAGDGTRTYTLRLSKDEESEDAPIE